MLGPLEVWTNDGVPVPIPDAKVRALLADLLAHEGRPVPADRLIEDLWGPRLPRNPAATLQSRVSQLRRALDAAEPGARASIARAPAGYRVEVSAESVDAMIFRGLVEKARAARDPGARADLFAEALGHWRGAAYADFADDAFPAAAARALEEERVTVIGEHAQARLDLGQSDRLATELADLVAHHPYCERLRVAQLRALYQSGRQREALASYADLRARLADELGIDPGPEVSALHEAILRQDPALAPASRAAEPAAEAIVDVSITAESAEWLGQFTRDLIVDRLAARGTIVPGVRSIQRGEGAIDEVAEAMVVLHTRHSLVPAILERVRAQHPATIPAVVAVPISRSHPGYRQWILDSTAEDRTSTGAEQA